MPKNILEFLERSAALFDEKIAVKDQNSEYSFQELANNSMRCGSALAEKKIAGKVIPIFMDNNAKAVIAFLGTVYAGACYSFINPSLPKYRISTLLELMDPPLLISDNQYFDFLSDTKYHDSIFNIDEIENYGINKEELDIIRANSIDTDPLYVNFTSGSTGIPKGVVVGHKSVIDFIENFTSIFKITSNDIIGNQAPFDFDVSVKDLYSMLYTGATMYIIPKEAFAFPKKLLDIIEQERISTLIWAVSAVCIISSLNGFSYKRPCTIRKVIFSGEVMPINHLRIWQSNLPSVEFYNVYGPTEITCNCTYYPIEDNYSKDTPIPIGKSFPNYRVMLFDESQKQITIPNKTGEICVSGSGLALGYYKDKEKTDKAFVINPEDPLLCERMYKTGDLGHFADDGNLIFIGRKDFQIKHMGHRIELGEIESHISQVDYVDRVCCQYDNDSGRIIAFYQGNVDKKDIAKYLRLYVDKYMIPNIFINIENMPITANGKINRKKLMEIYYESYK